jgi:hypothetical protein
VCPILKKAPDGRWVCSVDTADVRPFWGRAAAWFGGAAIVLFVAGTILAFGYLRIVGYPVRLGSVAWPPSWHEVREARASYLFQKAELSLHADSDSPPAKK